MTQRQGNSPRLGEILLVEDNPADIDLIRIALSESSIKSNLVVRTDGESAIEFLRHEVKTGRAGLPDLILLDLNLPKKDGREVLEEIKTDDVLKIIPVIILTTSSDQKDIQKCYNLHANCYVVKALDLDRFMDFLKSIENFWFTVVALPMRSDNEV